MQKPRSFPLVLVLLVDLAIVALLVYAVPRLMRSLGTGTPAAAVTSVAPTPVKAKITAILETGAATVNGVLQPYQIVQVQVLEGKRTGQLFVVDYGKTQLPAPGVSLRVGEQVMLDVTQMADGSWKAYFVDFVRTPSLLWLLALFVVSSVLLSGWKGVRSMLSMLFSFAVIIGFILPRILQGENPVLISTMGAFAILATTIYVVYGWTLKSHAAVLGTLFALSITGLLAFYFIGQSRLTGFGSEEAMFLSQQLSASLDLRGLVLSGILIGTLGVLDDLVITQASAVLELHIANPSLTFTDLYRRSMRIGQDHVAATVNTLVLAYTGAALPLLLLVSLAGERLGAFVNREFVTEEVVRTLVGSLGLITAVPVTTGLACLVALHHGRLGRLRPYLGPLTSSGGHDTHHHHH
jgi:uncharacterized membrane protein